MAQDNGKLKIIIALVGIITTITLFGTGILAKGVIDNKNDSVQTHINMRTEYVSRDERTEGKLDSLKDDFFREVKEINTKQGEMSATLQYIKENMK